MAKQSRGVTSFQTAVGRRAYGQSAQKLVVGRLLQAGGGAMIGLGAVSGEPVTGAALIGGGVSLVGSGGRHVDVARRTKAKGRALEDLILRAQGRDLGSKVRRQQGSEIQGGAGSNKVGGGDGGDTLSSGKSAVRQRADKTAAAAHQRGERTALAGNVIIGGGVLGLAANPIIAGGAISMGAAMVDAGSRDMSASRGIAARGRVLDSLIQRARGQNIGARVQAARLDLARGAAADATGEMRAQTTMVSGQRTASGPQPGSDGMVDAYVRHINGKAVQVKSYSTPDRKR